MIQSHICTAKLKKSGEKKQSHELRNSCMAFSIGNREEQVCLPKVETASTSERFTYQAPWKISSFSTPQEGNTIPWRSLLLPSHSRAKLLKKKAVTIVCQLCTTASFLKALQSGFTSGHRIETVCIAAQPITTIEKSLILPYTAICKGVISQKYHI